ncbi:MAG: hypothetical protein OXI69_00525 [Acidobacteriota bacterium]|nr:hypothetical protein [Acidobacteriota bacterium]
MERIINTQSPLQNSEAGRLPEMATKGTKTQFVPFVVKKQFYQAAPDIEKGKTQGLPAR